MPTHAVCRRRRYSTTATWSHWTIPFLITLLFKCVLKAHSWNGILLPSQQHQHQHDSLLSSTPASCPATNPNLYYQPVIGILSHPGDGASGRLSNATNASYVAASYVKLAEAGGARVIPLIYNEPPEKLLKKLDLINGVIFTGGWAKDGLYLETVRRIFKKVLQKNDAGDHFPLYGVCLGFELLTMIVSEDNNILEEFSASNQASTLQFVEYANIEGSIFQSFPPDLLKKLSTDCIVMQNHHFGVSPGRLQDNHKLSSFFEILTTSKDEDDKVYVSTVRSRNYPVTGFQWHPEKNAFEWSSAKNPTHGGCHSVKLGNPQTDQLLKKYETISFTITDLLMVGRLGKDMSKFISSHKNAGGFTGYYFVQYILLWIMIVCSRK